MERVFRNEKYNWCDKLILGLFCFLIFISTISLSSILKDYKILKDVIYGLENEIVFVLAIVVLIDNFFHKKRISIAQIILFAFSYFSMYVNGYNGFIIIMIFAITLCKYDIDDIFKKVYPVLMLGLVIVIFLCMCGISKDCVVARKDGDLRYALGFWHPNNAATVVMIVFLLKLYLSKFKLSLIDFLMILFATIVVFYITDSRASMIVTMFAIIVSGIYSVFGKNLYKFKKIYENGIFQKILILFPFIFCGISVLLTILYSNRFMFMDRINSLFSGRLYYSSLAFEEYSLSLFGINRVSDVVIILDNNYIYNFYGLGVVNTIIVLSLLSISIFKMIKDKNYSLVFVELLILSFCMMETIMLYYKMNIFCIVFSIIFCQKEKQLKRNNRLWLNYQS